MEALQLHHPLRLLCYYPPVRHHASMINWNDPLFVWTVVGTIAAVLGTTLGVYVLWVTWGARKAARAAQSSARKRSLIEELEGASQKSNQLGDLLHHQQWFAVQMRIQEISSACIQILSRWPDGLSEEKRDDLVTAAQLARSIAARVSATGFDGLSERARLVGVQLRLSDRISSALGEARKTDERTPIQP
jgi:hypothetical protein